MIIRTICQTICFFFKIFRLFTVPRSVQSMDAYFSPKKLREAVVKAASQINSYS